MPFPKYRGKYIGYSSEECKNCGRLRVEVWENGEKVCEKCNYNQDTEIFEVED